MNPTPSAWAQPLPLLQQQDFQRPKLVTPPDQGALMLALNKISQRLEALENKMSHQLN